MRTVLLLLLVLSAAQLHAAPESVSPDRFEADIIQFEQQDRQDPPEPGAILFVSSSSIRLWQHLASDFPDRHVLNRGFGGSQIADLTYYAGRLVVPCRPSRIVFYAGDNARTARYAARHRRISYIDVFTPMLAEDGTPRTELFGPDGLHMNRLGYELWKNIIQRSLPPR